MVRPSHPLFLSVCSAMAAWGAFVSTAAAVAWIVPMFLPGRRCLMSHFASI